jgi:hypothetical protein
VGFARANLTCIIISSLDHYPQKTSALEKWAADELRSVNGQIEFLLREAARKGGRLGDEKPREKPEKKA